jgi:transposase
LGRSLQKRWKPCKLLVGIVILKKKTAVYDWYNHFKSGQEVLVDEPHGCRPSTSVNAEANSKVKELVHADQQITTSEAANEVGITYGSAK